MKKTIAFLCMGVAAFALNACGGSPKATASTVSQAPMATAKPATTTAPTPTTTPVAPTATEAPISMEDELSVLKNEILEYVDYAYSGFTSSRAPMYYLLNAEGSRVVLILESAKEDTYIQFMGDVTIDEESGLITVTDDERGYTFGFFAEAQNDGSYFLDCGNLGECILKPDKPVNVVESILQVYGNKEDVTDKFMVALMQISDQQDELLNYINVDLKAMKQVDEAIMDGLIAVTGSNYIDDQTLYDALTDELIPISNALISEVENLEYESHELEAIHELYLSSMQLKNESFVLLASALETADSELMKEAETVLSWAAEYEIEYFAKLKEYAKANGVDTTGI